MPPVGALVTDGDLKVIITEETEALQLSLLVDVSVNLTEPAAISAAEGRYDAFSAFGAGENVPVPAVDHMPVVVPPVTEPANCTDAPFVQTV